MTNVNQIAWMCHEVNKMWCELHGDFFQRSWQNADKWQRDSAIKAVEYALANPDLGPEDQHNAWQADKIADGWVYGDIKDAITKTHPCLLPYDELPEVERKKDALFRAVVKALA